MALNLQKKYLLRWCGWFFFINVVLFWLIGLRYFVTLHQLSQQLDASSWMQNIAIISQTIIIYLGHFASLALIPSLLIWALIFVLPFRTPIVTIAILFASFSLMLLIIDTVIYTMFRFHFGDVLNQFILHGFQEKTFTLSAAEIIATIIFIVLILALETFIAVKLWRVIRISAWGKWGKQTTIALCTLIISAYILIVVNTYQMNNVVVLRILPFYRQAVMLIQSANRQSFPPIQMARLHIPTLLAHHQTRQPLNLVLIVIDTWRFDMLNQEVTPNLYQFAQHAWRFSHHYSGGNATAPGIFSLFYGLPASYWPSVESQQQGPLLINALLDAHYQMGIFASASLKLPDFKHTVFSAIHPLANYTEGESPYDRDKTITQKFRQFIARAKKKPEPFFSFVFYDAAHNYCDFNESLTPFQPSVPSCKRFMLNNTTDPVPYLNRYKNALHLIDTQIREVLAELTAQHLLERTVVIVTGDHGEEFNDNHLGYWGHASNFTEYQVRTPLIVYWPGEKEMSFDHVTSHFDVVPTLMNKLFADHSPINAYSTGKLLADNSQRPYLIVGSYTDLGIIEPDRITTFLREGTVEVERPDGHLLAHATPSSRVMRHVIDETKRFY